MTGGGVSLLYHSGIKLRPNEPVNISAPIDPYNWYFPSGEQIERKDLMVVLTNLDGIYIKASYGIEVDGQARLSNVKLDSATEVPLCAEDDDYCDDTIKNPVTR